MILHTGGALGSDFAFSGFASKAGLSVVHHSFDGHGGKFDFGMIERHSNEELDRYMNAYLEVVGFLERFPTKNIYVLNLLLRDMIQADRSDCILAVGIITKGWINGGTAYCVTRAYIKNKPIYFYEQNLKTWFKVSKEKSFIPEIPLLKNMPENIAGVGTRKININGVNAIKDLFKGDNFDR